MSNDALCSELDDHQARLEIHHCGKVYLEHWHGGCFVCRSQVLPIMIHVESDIDDDMCCAPGWIPGGHMADVDTGEAMTTPYDPACLE